MFNVQFQFNNAWLLLLLIPAVALTFLYYFRLNKKYRRNRNRITSIVLHLLVMFLTIFVLAGMTIKYDVANKENEILLVVDASHSSDSTQDEKEEFIRGVIEANSEKFKVGVVTFGYNQVYAAELSYNVNKVYDDYLNSEAPDESATNIAAALSFAREQFSNPETAKIVLLTDGVETDGSATTVIKSLAAEGIRVDTVYFENASVGDEVQIMGAVTPDYSIKVGDEFPVTLSLESSFVGEVAITVVDNDSVGATINVELKEGVQEVEVRHAFTLPGLHKLEFRVECGTDNLSENNTLHSYIYLEVHDKILIVSRDTNEASALTALLENDYENMKLVNVADKQNMPQTLDELRAYDQVILLNVSNYDILSNAPGFIDILHSYVYDIGGGLFTVGGNKTVNGEIEANLYNRSDLLNSTYQKMLPIQAVDYTPPLGVIIIIDRSGSMGDAEISTSNLSYLGMAKEGAMSALNAMTDRDWCGIYTLEEDFSEEIALTPVTQRWKIEEAIENIKGGGGTEYSGAIDRAGSALAGFNDVELARKHIVLVSDGQPSDTFLQYSEKVRLNKEKGITFSMVLVGGAGNKMDVKRCAEEIGGGRFYEVTDKSQIATAMRGDLEVPAIKEFEHKKFQPTLADSTPVISGIKQVDIPELGGFYGTKAKDGAEVALRGLYNVPIYAQWRYGKGSVGSFMCDLSGGDWSGDFMNDATGVKLIKNMVGGLFPTDNIQPQDIELELEADNYTTKMSVYTKLTATEHLEVTITGPNAEGEDEERKIVTEAGGDYSRINFEIRYAGVYNILVEKKAEDGTVVSSRSVYKAFSYSDEYDCFYEVDVAEALVEKLAEEGRGDVIFDPMAVYRDFKATITREYDPTIPFIIAALIFFLADIAVRKFKFKWPHELIREYKNKKQNKN